MPTSMPGLIDDDSNIDYCNADHLPEPCGLTFDNRKFYCCPHLISLEMDKVYEFLLIDDTTDENIGHPVHMHGSSFQIIDMGTLEQLKSGKTPFKNATHRPVIKDAVIIPRNGFVKIRMRTSNPGYWVIHCHIEYHMAPGMVVTLKVGDKKDMPTPPANFPTCGNFLIPIDEF